MRGLVDSSPRAHSPRRALGPAIADERTLAGSHYRLAPPQHLVRLVGRPALLEKLDEGLRRRLTIVHAPAGYGKTVLLSQWKEELAARGALSLWITLDRDDGGAGFIRWIRTALAEAGLMSGEVSEAPTHPVQSSDVEEILGELLHSLDQLTRDLAIILDDYHLVQSVAADALMLRLLKETPACVHLVLGSRTRPLLPLAALRAQGNLQELSQDDLRLSDREAQELIELEIPHAALRRLNQYVEGWPIALQLANFWMRSPADVDQLLGSFAGSVEDMADYLASQIFAELEPHLQAFLEETSILDLLSADVSDAVRGREDSQRMLDELRRLNVLLVPVDRHKRHFRHHHLFSEHLKARQARLGGDRRTQLHRAASTWFEANDDLVRAVRHAASAGDRARATNLAEGACTLWLCLTEPLRARALLNTLTPMEIDGSCRLLLTLATVRFKEGDLVGGRQQLERAQAARAAMDRDSVAPDLDHDLTVMVLLRAIYQDAVLTDDDLQGLESLTEAEPDGSWGRGLAYIMSTLVRLRRGELSRAKAMTFQAIRNLRDADSLYARMFCYFHLGSVALAEGQVAEAHNAFHTAEDMALEHFPGNAAVLALAQVLMAEVAYERNNVNHATELLDQNLAVMETSETWSEIYIAGYRVAAAIAVAADDTPAGLAVLDRAERVAAEQGLPRLKDCAIAQRVSILAGAGELGAARSLFDAIDRSAAADARRSWVERDELGFAAARLALAEGRPARLSAGLCDLASAAQAQGRRRSMMRAKALNALAHKAAGDVEGALRLLVEALDVGGPEGAVRAFVDEGAPMAELLSELSRTAGRLNLPLTMRRYIEHLQSAFGDLRRSPETARLMQLLTTREQQILRELSRGSSNKVIARALELTEDGVKFHLKNIYRKLGVASRVMALTVAQKLDLV